MPFRTGEMLDETGDGPARPDRVPNACPMTEDRVGQLRARAFENMMAIALVDYPAPGQDGGSSPSTGWPSFPTRRLGTTSWSEPGPMSRSPMPRWTLTSCGPTGPARAGGMPTASPMPTAGYGPEDRLLRSSPVPIPDGWHHPGLLAGSLWRPRRTAIWRALIEGPRGCIGQGSGGGRRGCQSRNNPTRNRRHRVRRPSGGHGL